METQAGAYPAHGSGAALCIHALEVKGGREVVGSGLAVDICFSLLEPLGLAHRQDTDRHTSTHIHRQTHTYTRTHVHTHRQTHTHTHRHTQTYTHTQTHTHTHTSAQKVLRKTNERQQS